MADCIFCKIANKEIPAEVVYEDAHTTAVLDINPIAPGHTMILPKKHAENILDLDDAEVEPLFTAVKRVTALLNGTLHPDGFTIGMNHGKWAGQAIDHIHVHVIPRWKTDGGHSIHGVVVNPPTQSLTEIRKQIIKE
ncbi:MAG: HIT family protein [Patescibacteria group bacterium]